MKEIVDQVLQDYNLIHPLDQARTAESREKVSQYVATLASAGQKDPRRLFVFARAYLKELHEGPDPRFTGC
jgi:MoxR-like ATPase